jgi:hypothetical protein
MTTVTEKLHASTGIKINAYSLIPEFTNGHVKPESCCIRKLTLTHN